MSNRTIPILMGFVAVLVLAVGVMLVVLLASGGGDDDDSLPDSPNGDDNGDTGGQSLEGFCEGQFLVTYGSDPASILDPIQVRDDGTPSTSWRSSAAS